jgi:hypothetical protein
VPPFVGVAVKVTEVPEQIVVAEAPMLTLAGRLGLTTILFVADVVPHDPPLVVNVNVIGVVELAAAVNVAVPGVLPVLLAKVPLGADHTAAVAPPPKEPPSATDVPPWQMAAMANPASAVGFGLTVIVTAFDVAGFPVKQGVALEVMTQVTTSLFANAALV